MASMGSFNVGDMNRLRSELEKMEENIDEFLESCARELAARLLEMVIKRTPVGDYSGDAYECASGKSHKGNKVKGKVGGTLRRGWTNGNRISAKGYADTVNVNHYGDTYVIDIINPVEYASYVEYGHRKPNNKGWVRGHFMMTISEQKLKEAQPQILERRIRRYMEEMNGRLNN